MKHSDWRITQASAHTAAFQQRENGNWPAHLVRIVVDGRERLSRPVMPEPSLDLGAPVRILLPASELLGVYHGPLSPLLLLLPPSPFHILTHLDLSISPLPTLLHTISSSYPSPQHLTFSTSTHSPPKNLHNVRLHGHAS